MAYSYWLPDFDDIYRLIHFHNVYKNKRVFNNRYKDWDHNIHGFVGSMKVNKNGVSTMPQMSNNYIAALHRIPILNVSKVNKHYMKLK